MKSLPLALVLGFAVLLLGCNGNSSSSSSAATDFGKVELSMGKVTFEPTTKVMMCEVKYRFVQGKPVSGAFYKCEADVGSGVCVIATLGGVALKMDGTLKNECPVLKAPDKIAKISMMAGPHDNGPFTKISNDLEVNVE
jgi:hypothetical protein